ncbi:MAG: Ppx/GppA phosphatase family protein [Myxococcota bacterium]
MRVAAIDVGTNSIHLLVADVGPDGVMRLVEKQRNQVELGRGGLDQTRIADDAMARGIRALTTYRHTIEALGAEAITAAATSAVREAENGPDFVRAVQQATGIHIRPVSGAEEARLLYQGVKADLDFSDGPVLLVDIGGGSLEIVACNQDEVLLARSMPLGHIRLSERFFENDPPRRGEWSALTKHVEQTLHATLEDIRSVAAIARLVGTSGSIRTLGRMATRHRGEQEPPHGQGLVIGLAELKALQKIFAATKRARLADVPGMDPRRRATLPAAAVVIRAVLEAFEPLPLVTSDRSLRDGLLADWVERHRPELAASARGGSPRRRTVLRMMDRYTVDRAHVEQVRRLALAIFDGLELDFDEPLLQDLRAMLEDAALLHDIGHHINGRDHHKHGQYLILNSRMVGFTAPDVAVLANVVRYHRGRPKSDHPAFATLESSQQRKVELLSGILRAADSLDRSHGQLVQELAVEDDGTDVTLIAGVPEEAHIERWAAERSTSRLSNVLDRSVTVRVALIRPARDARVD